MGELIGYDKITELEAQMRACGTIELEVKHHFSKGVYARELHIPAGTVLTGDIHKYENLNILSCGEMSVLIDGRIQTVCAPFTVVSPPGTKRVAYAHTDCIWTTIHGTDKTDVDAIRAEFVTDTVEGYLEFRETLKLQENQ